ncbi:ABC transporter permease [Oceanibacterium hippocampi]|uniref:Putative aliphatic sulfonates transport permease protein SsuC n=1 Tax=Oceanibacterium hippocampi TaxID=745714 RepID=A0A1Y5TWY6_9PROT|nr:ABC transporter permease [Oceanibacterium hippocampi]SLN75503.1 Putative aliphatic sulfonates transport permease protein SsuC [Oceanibacterium hippocampi]
MTSWRNQATPVAAIVIVLIAWELLARANASPNMLLPPITAVLADIWANLEILLRGVRRTLTETLLGLVFGAAFGFVAGAVFAQVRIFEKMFFPLFVVSQTVPVIAFGALVVMWFGNGIMSKVVIAFYLTFFPVTVNTHRGLLSVDQQRVDLLRAFGASSWKIFWSLRLPAALPSIMASLLLGVSLSLIGAIVGEWFGDTVGLGILLVQAMYAEDMVRLWSIIVFCGLLGTGLYGIVAWFARRYVWWGTEY